MTNCLILFINLLKARKIERKFAYNVAEDFCKGCLEVANPLNNILKMINEALNIPFRVRQELLTFNVT